MAKIKIGDNREIQLLTEKKDPSAKHIKIGNFYGELTEDKSKTNGNPLLKFSKDGKDYYIREKFVTKFIGSKTFRITVGKLWIENVRGYDYGYVINSLGKVEDGVLYDDVVLHTFQYENGYRPSTTIPMSSSILHLQVLNSTQADIEKRGLTKIRISCPEIELDAIIDMNESSVYEGRIVSRFIDREMFSNLYKFVGKTINLTISAVE